MNGYPGLGGEPLDVNSGSLVRSIAPGFTAAAPAAGQPWSVELVADGADSETLLERIRDLAGPLLSVTDVSWADVADFTGLDRISGAAANAYEQARLVVRGVYGPAAAYVGTVNEALEPLRALLTQSGQLWKPTAYSQGGAAGGGFLADLSGTARSITILVAVAVVAYLLVKIA